MINLAEEWRKLNGRRRTPDSQKHWDERAKSFSFKDTPDAYLQSFILKAGITGEESVLDMGCGTGSLAVALASMGCSVVAADFSTGMLDRLRSKAAERGVLWERGSSGLYSGGSSADGAKMRPSEIEAGKILPLRMSWEDDWSNYGVEENSVDVAVASRSVITHDLEDSLQKLSAVACEKVCVTVGTGFSPRVDMRVARAMGLELERHNDALFVFGIASDLGYEPTVSYIHSPRTKSYISPDEAYHSLLRTRDYLADTIDQISVEESACRLRNFLADHLVEIEEDGTKRWALDQSRVVPWAFISWDVRV